MSAEGPKAVPADRYTESYYLGSCGGIEFYRLYGPTVAQPGEAWALRRAALKPGMTALDLGCGKGELLYALRKEGVYAVGGDYARAGLELAAKEGLGPVLRCDAKRLPFKDKTFDRIFLMSLLDHLHDWELELCFAELARVLKPGGFVLADTCANTRYYKNWTYGLRKALARALGLKAPSPPRSSEDEELHVNEHDKGDLERFFGRIGWRGEIEYRPNEKSYLEELYGKPLPKDFPLKPLSGWKKAWHALSFRGPWKALLARDLFCVAWPGGSPRGPEGGP